MFRDIPWTRLNTARFALITAALGKTKSFSLKSQSHFITEIFLQNYLEESLTFSRLSLSDMQISSVIFSKLSSFSDEIYNENRLC
jgi:hypothetical protein